MSSSGDDLRFGFSIVEILVVVTVLAVLAAITTPILLRAKSRAVSITCLSNEMQVTKAIELYAGDYDGLMNFGQDYGVDYWYGPVSGYSGGSLTGCPSFHANGESEWPKFGYSMNNCLSRTTHEIRNPSSTVLLTEVTSNHLRVGHGELNVAYVSQPDIYEYERPVIASTYEADLPYGAERHKGGSNYSLIDGHAVWKRLDGLRLQNPPSGCEDSSTTQWQGPPDGPTFVP